ncbi:protein kinase domain protein [Ichthyophthirius multifiliis]|uniref:Mitogen-activated protein kinase n=1 Tax=Ichthyophthirius multifiliis TaxID=5932 RepID=G0QZX4_ICHMU|nr:protein kinase domain protein [Ichthyophthirius multifiliis]EGR29236.1 protein kinase domain protein [Ichthyophthirius multifiliis]|eukprot:XP_004030472.1 protein kinase domain protein [Ichthyophthirius multifiliis]
MSEEIEPHILRKFEIIQKLGKGAYGIVWKAIDRKLKQVVALKKVFDAFHNPTDAQRTFREVMFLQELNGHDNIIKLLNIIKAENNKDLYLVFDYMETDLHAVIRADILEPVHKKYIMYQILKALKYIHSGELIHRDLKPSNILLNSECHVKVADFGLARSVATKEEDAPPVLTEYVATRWYRAPEILLGSTKYTKSVDMWSVGCILGELIIGKSIFPGVSTLNQIERVLELTGKPSQQDIESIESPLAQNIINSINIQKKKNFNIFFSGACEDSLDLLKKLLTFNPKLRFTAEQALEHKYVNEFHNIQEEHVCNKPIEIPLNDHEKFSIKKYREALYADISERKKQQRKKWQAKYLEQLGLSVPEQQQDKINQENNNQIIKVKKQEENIQQQQTQQITQQQKTIQTQQQQQQQQQQKQQQQQQQQLQQQSQQLQQQSQQLTQQFTYYQYAQKASLQQQKAQQDININDLSKNQSNKDQNQFGPQKQQYNNYVPPKNNFSNNNNNNQQAVPNFIEQYNNVNQQLKNKTLTNFSNKNNSNFQYNNNNAQAKNSIIVNNNSHNGQFQNNNIQQSKITQQYSQQYSQQQQIQIQQYQQQYKKKN